jgi:hypothetical protein
MDRSEHGPDRVAGEVAIRRHHDEILHEGLSDEDAVERVAVDRRKESDLPGVRPRDGNLTKSMLLQMLREIGLDRKLADLLFDRDLPKRGSADKDVLFPRQDPRACGERRRES